MIPLLSLGLDNKRTETIFFFFETKKKSQTYHSGLLAIIFDKGYGGS